MTLKNNTREFDPEIVTDFREKMSSRTYLDLPALLRRGLFAASPRTHFFSQSCLPCAGNWRVATHFPVGRSAVLPGYGASVLKIALNPELEVLA